MAETSLFETLLAHHDHLAWVQKSPDIFFADIAEFQISVNPTMVMLFRGGMILHTVYYDKKHPYVKTLFERVANSTLDLATAMFRLRSLIIGDET